MELNLSKIQLGYQTLQEAKSSRIRFRLEASPEDVAACLGKFYLLEVQRRCNAISGLDDFTCKKINQVARWFTEGHKPGLFLCGDIGSGKTTMARAMVELINANGANGRQSHRKYVLSVTAKELTEMKNDDVVSGQIDSDTFFEARKRSEMLFIDDLGTEPVVTKRWGNEHTPVVDILFYRHDCQLFTIVTSNLDDPAAIKDKYGPRIADRFKEMFDFISYNKESYRK